jgi:acyl-[acyl-carrier-protein]-phospholipid O-acyltransferase / long-chain-fatty-acid--[acyl-carrier-protein] ligase
VTMAERVLGWITWRARRLPRQADDAAVVLFKQTANGQRGVVLSHANLIANAAQIEARLVLSRSDTILSVLPLHTALGLTVGLILPLMKGVRALAYPSPLHTRQIPQVAGTRHPTILFATDALLAAYAKAAQTTDFDSLRLIVSGGERLRVATRQLWAERFGKTIMEGYGLTEASPVVAVNSITHGRPGTVGRLLPGMRMRIEPIDGFEQGGRLKIAGPNIAIRYLSADEAMATDGWFDTGDIVSVDREGYLTTLGRAGRLAAVGGTTVSLALVEEAAEAIWPDSIHAAISLKAGAGDDRIVLVTTHSDADRAVLARQWKQHGFDDVALPSKLIPIRSMPTTANGRIDHARLVAICEEELGLSSAA